MPPPKADWKASPVVGKSEEFVNPVTKANPLRWTAMARPASSPVDPPRYVE